MKIFHFLRLIRPANIVTSIADVLAGISIAGFFALSYEGSINWVSLLLLCLSTACLYAGGIVFNDVFDLELDRLERPERAIPSGQISLREATLLGAALLLAGVSFALAVSFTSGILAFLIAAFALIYDKYSKHFTYIGPLNMGLCRGLNLLLGISVSANALSEWYALAVFPILYIFSITLISQGEVHGGGKPKLYTAALLYGLVAGSIVVISVLNRQTLQTVPLVIFFMVMIFRPLLKAIKEPIGRNIGLSVKAGVLSLILMDAAWAACFYALYAALFIVCLLPLSIWLGKRFAVT